MPGGRPVTVAVPSWPTLTSTSCPATRNPSTVSAPRAAPDRGRSTAQKCVGGWKFRAGHDPGGRRLRGVPAVLRARRQRGRRQGVSAGQPANSWLSFMNRP
ncbi:hypothetical protein ETD86_35335 [Nonomuraea turkmeniaca]|uniref:Uncharacterized protein n=1 Tax=Nonomuraea turkmeniaca TaxID=103838 RepID=A0A5S4F619_9ACTN|nr:hypothetical protein ETD86_35335 [Nonomuraea turkmeniaca]